jgi:hypothetical protein
MSKSFLSSATVFFEKSVFGAFFAVVFAAIIRTPLS